ncbi:MAG: hypothetical protein RBR50_09010 [Candidatus Izemoplasmatales bacterium]|nr:hypothetical protein [Candidatus Izemoplasmatales bacterium]
MSKIYLIEGLPGSGKTTFARRLNDFLINENVLVKKYNEGDLHPVDLAWTAIFDDISFITLKNKYPELVSQFKDYLKKIDDLYYLAYTNIKIDVNTKDFYDYCERCEIYKTRDIEYFFSTHLRLWQEFLSEDLEDDYVYIFECIFLQNHINELILKYGLNEEEIIAYFKKFSKVFSGFDVNLIYINQNNPSKILQRITEERRTNNKELYRDWIDHVIEYVEQKNISGISKYNGYSGVESFLIDRKKLEEKVLSKVSINTLVLELNDDYDQVFEEIKKFVKI